MQLKFHKEALDLIVKVGLQEADSNKDNKIDFSEFVAVYQFDNSLFFGYSKKKPIKTKRFKTIE